MPADPSPEGADAVKDAATNPSPSPQVAASALAFFMGDAPPPGSTPDDHFPLSIDFGTVARPNFQTCTFRPLDNEELVKCEELATVKDDAGQITRIDPFTRWSYVYAYACITPDLDGVLRARIEKGDTVNPKTGRPWVDTADLVRHVFRKQPGVLQQASHAIEERSRLGQERGSAVREVEAGKGSS